MLRRFAPDGDFRAIHLEQARIAERRTAGCGDQRARQETELHQPPGVLLGKVNGVEDGGFARTQVGQTGRSQP